MKNSLKIISLTAICLIFSFLPFLILKGEGFSIRYLHILILLNFSAWSMMAVLLVSRYITISKLEKIAKSFGLSKKQYRGNVSKVINAILYEVKRRLSPLSLNVLDNKIVSGQELSTTLEKIAQMSFTLLKAESVELALFDPETNTYHSSFVLGKPFGSNSQALLSGALDGKEINNTFNVLVVPIAFAGSILGTLRVAKPQNQFPTVGDKKIIELLAVQSGIAIINAKYTEELLKMKRVAKESVKAKTGFLANLSHEIRGPLGVMINAVELILDGLCGEINKEQEETLSIILNNGQHLLELINDVLDYAKVESGRIIPNKIDINLNELVQNICNVMRKEAELKKHKLIFKSHSEQFCIHGDRRHLRQILINIITNAIKYTPEGGEINVWLDRAPGNKVKINIKDNGVGIKPEDKDKVFQPFERIADSYSLSQVGAGLGMSLTKKLVEVNNGKISFSSESKKGTLFWVTFPMVKSSVLSSNIDKESDIEEKVIEGKGELIFLLQQDDDEKKMIARYLTSLGFKVASADKEQECVPLIEAGEISLLIVDNTMVDANKNIIGFLKKNNINLPPIILITTRAFAFNIQDYLKEGVDRCLVKPVALKKLALTCREMIDGSYKGDVIDNEELNSLDINNQDRAKEGKTNKSKFFGVDDILH